MSELEFKELKNLLRNQSEMICELKNQLASMANSGQEFRKWIPKSEVMKFLGFAETQMVAITKQYNLLTTTIGKRKFYSAQDILRVLESQKSQL